MKSKREPDLEEFKFHYHFDNTVGFSDKYFMAHDYKEAKEMFEVCLLQKATKATTRQCGKMESLER